MTTLTDAEFNELFTTFERTAFRLETLQVYRVPGLDEQFETFLRGDPLPPRNPETSPWLRQIADNAGVGKRTYRVHVVDQPLSDYLRYELDSYQANVAAGEDVFLVDRTTHPDLEALREDFWLFDERDLILMRYDPDGRYLGAERATDPDRGEYLRRRDLALAHAVPLHAYVAEADA
ncbi:MAG: DUF6879 family protein [Egibacteraceae bacterium]